MLTPPASCAAAAPRRRPQGYGLLSGGADVKASGNEKPRTKQVFSPWVPALLLRVAANEVRTTELGQTVLRGAGFESHRGLLRLLSTSSFQPYVHAYPPVYPLRPRASSLRRSDAQPTRLWRGQLLIRVRARCRTLPSPGKTRGNRKKESPVQVQVNFKKSHTCYLKESYPCAPSPSTILHSHAAKSAKC